jgi:hypothetical protein
LPVLSIALFNLKKIGELHKDNALLLFDSTKYYYLYDSKKTTASRTWGESPFYGVTDTKLAGFSPIIPTLLFSNSYNYLFSP